ncbi:MAG: hypothetical protein ACRDRO_04090 [Pseudonocardiaceae bacterium]
MNHERPEQPMPPVTGCPVCRLPVRWVRTAATGTQMMVDAEADPARGNQQWQPRGRVVAQLSNQAAATVRARGLPLWLPHAVTCPSSAVIPAPRSEKRQPTATGEQREAARVLFAQTMAGRRWRYR